MHPLLARVRRTIQRHALMPRGAGVLAAVSGGSDSVALLHLLSELQEEGDLAVVGVAHLNHQLRGEAAEADERFCRDLAASRSLPFVVESIDVASAARERRMSIEQAGRCVRYEFLDRAAAALGARRIAVGHTRDDQAETFLLRLVRGAGPTGLAGIHPRAGIVVRPLLDVGRDELRAYLSDRAIGFREDASNLDVAVPRNRVRHELLPLLRERFSPAIVEALGREAEIAREDAEYLDQIVTRAESDVVRRTADGLVLEVELLRACPRALARRIVRRAMEQEAPERFVGFEAVEAVLQLAAGPVQAARQLDAPGQHVERCGDTIVLRSRNRRALAGGAQPAAPFSYPLAVPGEVTLPEAACRISAELAPSVEGGLGGTCDLAVVSATELAVPLTVRSRQDGDAFRPLGLGGRKKLQDFFVDRKVRRTERDRVPLVVDRQDRIVWVAGYALGEEFRVTDPGRAVVILKMIHLGGRG
jgi:tRNA(Ile)-lysidine synthase